MRLNAFRVGLIAALVVTALGVQRARATVYTYTFDDISFGGSTTATGSFTYDTVAQEITGGTITVSGSTTYPILNATYGFADSCNNAQVCVGLGEGNAFFDVGGNEDLNFQIRWGDPGNSPGPAYKPPPAPFDWIYLSAEEISGSTIAFSIEAVSGTLAPPASAPAAVPEPAGLTILTTGLAALCRLRRRRDAGAN